MPGAFADGRPEVYHEDATCTKERPNRLGEQRRRDMGGLPGFGTAGNQNPGRCPGLRAQPLQGWGLGGGVEVAITECHCQKRHGQKAGGIRMSVVLEGPFPSRFRRAQGFGSGIIDPLSELNHCLLLPCIQGFTPPFRAMQKVHWHKPIISK